MLGDEDACGCCCSYGEEVEVGAGEAHAAPSVISAAWRMIHAATAKICAAGPASALPDVDREQAVLAHAATAPISSRRSARSLATSSSLGSPAIQSPPEQGAQKLDGL